MEAVDVLSVAEVCAADCFCEGVFVVRGCDNVDVVCHEAVAMDFQGVFFGLLF